MCQHRDGGEEGLESIECLLLFCGLQTVCGNPVPQVFHRGEQELAFAAFVELQPGPVASELL